MPTQYSLEYVSVLIATLVGIGMVLTAFALSRVLAPRSKSVAKDIPYECGIPPVGHFWSMTSLSM